MANQILGLEQVLYLEAKSYQPSLTLILLNVKNILLLSTQDIRSQNSASLSIVENLFNTREFNLIFSEA